MVEMVSDAQSQADCCESFAVVLFNIRSGQNGGLESVLRAMAAMDVDFGILAETKIMGGIYTWFLSGYNVFASNAVSVRQGGVTLFWKPNKLYEIKEWQVRGPNVITFVVVMGVERYYAVGCYILPNNLTTLTHVEGAWNDCPKRHIPILLGDLNINLVSPQNKQDEMIAEQVLDVMGLVDVSPQFKQRCQAKARGRWTWQIRQGGRWVSSQCDYVLGREINRRRFCSVALWMPCHHDSDHRAVVAKIYSGAEKKLKAYQRRFSKFPIRLPRGPQGELETLFEELCLDVAPPPMRERPKNQWISDSTWVLINQRAALRRAGKLNQCGARVIGRCIKAALKGGRKQRAATVGDKIEGLLATGEVKEAWRCLKGWYTAVEDHAPKACHETLARQTEERKTLNARVPPPGERLPINVTPFDVPDGVPSDSEIREVVRELQNGQAAGATGLHAEHIKVWLRGVVQEEAETAPAGHGDKW